MASADADLQKLNRQFQDLRTRVALLEEQVSRLTKLVMKLLPQAPPAKR